jgi:hypothetical protein
MIITKFTIFQNTEVFMREVTLFLHTQKIQRHESTVGKVLGAALASARQTLNRLVRRARLLGH